MASKKCYHNPRCYVIVTRQLMQHPVNPRVSTLVHHMIMTKNHTFTTDFWSSDLLTFNTLNQCQKYISHKLFHKQQIIKSSHGTPVNWLIPVMFKNIKILKQVRGQGRCWATPYTTETIETVSKIEEKLRKKKYKTKQDIQSTVDELKKCSSDKNDIALGDNIKVSPKETKVQFTPQYSTKTKKYFIFDKTTKKYLIRFENISPVLTPDIQESSFFTSIGQAQCVINRIKDMSYWSHLRDLDMVVVNEKGKEVTLKLPTLTYVC